MNRSTTLTYAGLNLLAKGQTGANICFTRVIMGDGDIAPEQNIRQIESMVSPKLNLPIVSVNVTGVGTTVMVTQLKNTGLGAGFFAKEVGIFAKEGDDGDEILYAYRHTGLESEYIPAGGSSEVWDLLYDVVTVVDQAENVTAIINGDVSYITQLDFIKHENSENPHPNLIQKGDVVDTASYLNCSDDGDNKINKIAVSDLKFQILGDVSDIPILNSRVRQLERENANLALKMEAENMMPDCNMLLAENFVNPDSIDRLEVQVTSCAAGDDSIDVETNYGFIVGSHYWITDGVHAEYVHHQ